MAGIFCSSRILMIGLKIMKVVRMFLNFITVISLAGSVPINVAAAEQSFSTRELSSLVYEMTTTPERQQKALDRLASLSDGQLILLFNYFDDVRPIANRDVLFLNTFPNAFEKYFMTSAGRIDEVVVQFVCIRTRECVPAGDLFELEKTKAQLRSRFKMCYSEDKYIVPCRKSGIH